MIQTRTTPAARMSYGLIWLFLVAFTFLCFYPFYYLIIYTFSDASEAARGLSILPKGLTLRNIQTVLTMDEIPHALLMSEVENADELLAQMPADPQCADIVSRTGAKDTYYYSNANMSDNYAMIAQLIEDKDLCVMFAEMVRFNARIYPSATPLRYFQRSPYGLTPEQIEQTWQTMRGNPAFSDIEELTNNQNERFLFSTKHLTRRYAKAISDVDEFCD